MADSNSSDRIHRIREIYLQIKELESADEQEKYLASACRRDPTLRREVESLLEADEAANGFLDSTVLGDEIHVTMEQPGDTIGRYRLVQRLGEGGFGVVYRAEQREPVTREVALKIIKPGMDTNEVVARFAAERQALAQMDHPNIARIHDAGTTETGRPYFVMDLIEGQPITDYCDQRKLPVAKRLELFLQVSDAIEHAHQRGVVHRDLKPSNVVVVERDGKAEVKVIDFGIAKSMQGKLSDRTLITRREVLLGTPTYMSPEQLNLDSDQVDERSDVYSLGVLLYELIAGAPPFESDTLRQAAFAEVQRILQEVDPPKPSTRFERMGPKTTEIAQRRAVEPPSLQRVLRGDLDWIIMRAIEKEPGRRYAKARDLADDLQRHLRHEPVVAGPPGIVYRGRKFTRRHKGALASAAAIALVLMVAVVFGLRQKHQTYEAEQRARQAEALARAGGGAAGYPATDAEAQQLIQGIVSVEQLAQLSPDETMLAYVTWDLPDADLWVRDLATGQTRNLTESDKHAPGVYESCLTFVWSPDSKRIAYHWNGAAESTDSLRIIPARGGEIRILKPAN